MPHTLEQTAPTVWVCRCGVVFRHRIAGLAELDHARHERLCADQESSPSAGA